MDLAWGSGIQAQEVAAEFARRRLNIPRSDFETRRVIGSPSQAMVAGGGTSSCSSSPALWLQRSGLKGHAGEIATRPAEAGNETACNWIAAADEHDSMVEVAALAARMVICWPTITATAVRQIGRQCRQPIELFSAQRNSIATLWPSTNPASLGPGGTPIPGNLYRPRSWLKEPDHRHRRLLRARRERPRSCCAAQCEYEFSPSDVDCHATLPPEVVCMQ